MKRHRNQIKDLARQVHELRAEVASLKMMSAVRDGWIMNAHEMLKKVGIEVYDGNNGGFIYNVSRMKKDILGA